MCEWLALVSDILDHLKPISNNSTLVLYNVTSIYPKKTARHATRTIAGDYIDRRPICIKPRFCVHQRDAADLKSIQAWPKHFTLCIGNTKGREGEVGRILFPSMQFLYHALNSTANRIFFSCCFILCMSNFATFWTTSAWPIELKFSVCNSEDNAIKPFFKNISNIFGCAPLVKLLCNAQTLYTRVVVTLLIEFLLVYIKLRICGKMLAKTVKIEILKALINYLAESSWKPVEVDHKEATIIKCRQ